MEWVYDQLTSAFFISMIGRCEEGGDVGVYQFTIKSPVTKKNGNYKNITGNLVINFGNYDGYIERWTTSLRNDILDRGIALGDEKLDEKTGVLEIALSTIINVNVK